MSADISVVILCYKAGERIRGFVGKTIELLDKHAPSWEIILVGNYLQDSDDETPRIVKEIASNKKNVKAVAFPKEGMMGWDVRCGFKEATGNFICLIDGDEQMPSEDIIRVYKKIKEEELDFVTTHRIKRHDSIARKLNSRIYNLLFRILFPRVKVKDVNSKPKIFTRKAYTMMNLTSDDWFIDAEMVIQAGRLGLKTGEIQTEFYKCAYRKSFVKFSAVFEFIKNLFLARIRESSGNSLRGRK